MKRALASGSEKILIAIILLYSVFVAIVNPSFLSPMAAFDVMRSSSCTMVVAMGLLVVMLSGGIGVSFMSVALFGGYASTRLMLRTGVDNIAFSFAVSVSMASRSACATRCWRIGFAFRHLSLRLERKARFMEQRLYRRQHDWLWHAAFQPWALWPRIADSI